MSYGFYVALIPVSAGVWAMFTLWFFTRHIPKERKTRKMIHLASTGGPTGLQLAVAFCILVLLVVVFSGRN